MRFKWAKMIACTLAVSIACQSSAFVYAAETEQNMVIEDVLPNELGEAAEFELFTEESQETVVIEEETVSAPVTARQKVTVLAEKNDESGRYYTLSLNGYTAGDDIKALSFAVWNEADGYTIWHEAELTEDGSYKAVIDMAKYSGSGTYVTHCYSEKTDGTKTFVASAQFDAEVRENLNPVFVKEGFTDDTKTVYEIQYSNVKLADGEVMRAAVWSETDGQDDLKWINFKVDESNKAVLTVSVNDFVSAGKFQAHIYRMTEDGSNTFVAARSFDVPKVVNKKVEITADKKGNGLAVITIKNLPDGTKGVRVPVWSDKNQGDIHWYKASKSGSNWVVKMDLNNHKNNWSNYNVHVYATDANGQESFAGSTSVNYSFKTRTPEAAIDKTKGIVKISVNDLVFPEQVKQVRAALWSEADGQDDISWNVLDVENGDDWSVEVPLGNLHSAGDCVFHLYAAKENGVQVYVGGGRFTIETPSVGSVTVTTTNKIGDFTITVKDVSDTASKVEAVVWSQADKSDQITYELKKDANGNYSDSSNIKTHNCSMGPYQVQVYVYDAGGFKTAVQRLTMSFETKIGSFEVTHNEKETEYYLSIKNGEYPYGVQKMEAAVWSDANGQDDVKWYEAVAGENGYKATVLVQNHKTAGKYHAHFYATNALGEKVYVTAKTFEVANAVPNCTLQVANAGNTGTFDVVLKNITAASGVQAVRVAAWPEANSSAVKWYDAVKQSDGTYKCTVRVENHQYYCGVYQMHVYTTMGNGIQSFTISSSYDYKPSNYLYVTNEQGKGTRTIAIHNPSSAQNVRFAVWSDANGQDDCHWYTAQKAGNGSWKATVTYKDFKDAGAFTVHAYDGTAALQAGTFDFPQSEFGKNGWYYEEINGRVYKLYYVDDVLQKDVRGIIGKQSQYKAEVNRTRCTVTMYAKDGSNGYIIPVCAFPCSVGLPDTPTPTGTFNTLVKYRWHELMGPSYGQYCTRIVGGILFHSVAGSNMTSYNLSAAAFNRLGQPASHGCVRLCVRDAKWIYDNCPLGMTVRIYDSSYAGPFGKPEMVKIPSWQNWDPTDPAV